MGSMKINSWVGGVIIVGFSAFLVGFFILAVRNFNSDVDVLSSTGAQIKTISPQEKFLIDQWLQDNAPGISAQDVGYRYILQKYPERPWLSTGN